MKKYLKMLLLLSMAGSAGAGDLVMKLGTTQAPVYHRIPVTGNITVSPATGDIIVDPVANAGVGSDGWCPASGGGGCGSPPPTFTTPLAVSTNNLPSTGGSVTLTWATANATSCTATSNPSVAGWSGTVTSPTVVNLTASGNYTFDLTCTGPCGSVVASQRTVSVAAIPPPTACTNRPFPSALTRQLSMRNSPLYPQNRDVSESSNFTIPLTTYNPMFGTFPQAGQSGFVFIDTSKFVAMEFSTSGVTSGTDGELSWESANTNVGSLAVMISECPGDFEWITDARCKSYGGISALTWVVGTPQSPSAQQACPLQMNKTYYINAVFSQNGSYNTTSCNFASCYWFVTGVGEYSLMSNESKK